MSRCPSPSSEDTDHGSHPVDSEDLDLSSFPTDSFTRDLTFELLSHEDGFREIEEFEQDMKRQSALIASKVCKQALAYQKLQEERRRAEEEGRRAEEERNRAGVGTDGNAEDKSSGGSECKLRSCLLKRSSHPRTKSVTFASSSDQGDQSA